MNDTSVYGTWWDSYPYSTASVLALHPQYLALDRLAETLPASITKQVGGRLFFYFFLFFLFFYFLFLILHLPS